MPPIADEPHSISLRSWTLWMLATTLALCTLVATANAIVDPTAQLGTGLMEPIAAGPRDRLAKVALLDQGSMPDLVVLGSSRAKKIDPAQLAPEAERGINAAVVGGDIFEERVLTAWLADRATARDETFPQLVIGVDVEQFRDSSLQGSGFLDVPKVEAVARREAGDSSGTLGDELDRLERLLLTWQVTKASAFSVRARVSRPADAADAADPDVADTDEFTAAGVPRADAKWFGPAVARLERRTPDAISGNIAEYRGDYESYADDLDPDAVDDLHAIIRTVRAAGGPPPLLYLTPAHPRFVQALADDGRAARRRHVLDLLEQVTADGDAKLVDCSTCVDGRDRSWIDGVHPSPLGARQLARALAPHVADA